MRSHKDAPQRTFSHGRRGWQPATVAALLRREWRLAAIVALLAALAAAGSAIGYLAASHLPQPFSVLDLQLLNRPNDTYHTLQLLGSTGRRAYAAMNSVDLVAVPLLYGAAASLTLSLALPPSEPTWRWAYFCVWATAVLDAAENFGVRRLLRRYPLREDNIALFTSVMTLYKAIFGLVSCLLVATSLALWLAGWDLRSCATPRQRRLRTQAE